MGRFSHGSKARAIIAKSCRDSASRSHVASWQEEYTRIGLRLRMASRTSERFSGMFSP